MGASVHELAGSHDTSVMQTSSSMVSCGHDPLRKGSWPAARAARKPVSNVTSATNRKQFRANTYALRDHVAKVSPQRIRDCGRVRVDSNVHVHAGPNGAHFAGVATCSSVWECPVCRSKICVQRAHQIGRTATAFHAEHGPARDEENDAYRSFMLTLTIRHRRTDALRDIGNQILDAKRRFYQGGDWRRWKARWGAEYISGWETTYGDANGWHPHLHVLVLTREPMTRKQIEEHAEWFRMRWARAVAEKVDGVKGWREGDAPTAHQPDEVHGLDFRASTAGEYVAKLGLELADPGTKKANAPAGAHAFGADLYNALATHDDDEPLPNADPKRYTPLQLAQAHMDGERRDGLKLWSDYCNAMRGRKQLTWSRGLRPLREAAIEAMDAEFQEQESVVVTTLEAHQWDELRELRVTRMEGNSVGVASWRWGKLARVFPLDNADVRDALATTHGTDARCIVLDVAERYPPHVLDALLGLLFESNSCGLIAQNAKHWREYHQQTQGVSATPDVLLRGV